MARRFVVLVEWVDGDDDCHFDADEVQVFADSAASAVAAARDKWAATIGAEWPRCRVERVRILNAAARKRLALP